MGQVSFLIVGMFVLIFLGMPICFAFSVMCCIGVFMIPGASFAVIPQAIFAGMNSFTILAIPFFVLAGELMNCGGITERLVKLANLMVGRMKAGLSQVNIVTSMLFGGINGSAVADTSSVGGMLIPAMIKEGYDPDFSVAVTVASSVIGPIIPPSLVMVVYGTTVGTSIGALFMAGIIPGIIVGLVQMAVVILMGRTRRFPQRTERYTRKEVKQIVLEGLVPLGMPIIILGGILSGVFTPTEAGAISSVYALVADLILTKGKIVHKLPELFLKTAKTASSVLFIMGNAMIMSRIFASLKLSVIMNAFLTTHIQSKIGYILFVNVLLLIVGMFMEGNATIIILATILSRAAQSFGINPVQFGIMMCMSLVMGNATPPVGLCLFVGCDIGKVSLSKAAKAILPFILSIMVVILLVSFIPQLTLAIPKVAGLIK
jgi:C4-dicarboxylate transporter DctM subunit